METSEHVREGRATSANAEAAGYDLKFVRLDELREGGWYRELPDAQLEVMSHARLHRVPLGNADPEQKAREVVEFIVREQKS
jgi:hypothetical protein